ncbi:SdpI family protein [Pelotomaculum sp. PtaB.Bin117]|uniref:SdpI family protein n=1 Tax=Pelotomaculum sp. PtaB.Bin117 TaxID=1811694 RepID=UPI0009C904FB|nr:SdpI family protein [Pelotomaculum sp. PtaB.Bin117]OPX85908.1 MAG: Immunity protein SdpI [Pelotomaculum sp. PtaB.Bin117]
MKTENKKGNWHVFIRGEWPLLLIVTGALIAGFIIYPHLPEQVASHWNLAGEVDRYSSRFWGAFGIPVMTAAIYILMLFLPLIDPKKQNYQKFAGAYRLLRAVMVIFMTGLYAVIVANAQGYQVPVDRVVITGIAVLFIVMGNFMGQIRQNYFVGIKTPWTLANEAVWQKTHRLAARLWVAAGLAGLAAALAGGAAGAVIMGVSLGLAVIIPVAFSYLEFRRRQQ